MSLFGVIGRTALKAIQSNNKLVLKQWPQTPNYMSCRLINMFGKISQELAAKVPERPKRPQSGYNVFYKDLSVKLLAENPEMKIKDLAKTIGDQWKNLDPHTKQELLDSTRKTSEEYKQQIEKWRKSLNEQQKQTYLLGIRSRRRVIARRRLKSELKRLDYPIRAKSAFNLYIKEAIDNRERTDEPFNEIFKRVVANWKTLTPEEMAPYIEMAKSDKIRYIQEFSQWQEKLKTHDQKETLDRLTKLRSISSITYLNPDLKKEKTKKVIKKKAKKPKAKKLKTKTSQKIKAKPKVKSTSKSKKASKSKKTKTKSSKTKSTEKSKESKEKKAKKVESDSSDE